MASGSFQAVENSTGWQTPVFPVLRTGRQKDPNCKKLTHSVTSRPVCARVNQQLTVLSTRLRDLSSVPSTQVRELKATGNSSSRASDTLLPLLLSSTGTCTQTYHKDINNMK